eukprot:Pgem_evm1s7236
MGPTHIPPYIGNMLNNGYPPGYLLSQRALDKKKREENKIIELINDVDEKPESCEEGEVNHTRSPSPSTPIPGRPPSPSDKFESVMYPGYNCPPPPGTIITDPTNPFYKHV